MFEVIRTCLAEVKSSRTSLALRTSSRTHFEVLGLGLEASSSQKLPCLRLEDSTIFEPLKFRWKTPETLRKICKDLFFGFLKYRSPEKKFWRPFSPKEIFWRPFFLRSPEKNFWRPFFLRTLASVSLALASRGFVLGLEIFLCPCPWLWPRALCLRLHLCCLGVSYDPMFLWISSNSCLLNSLFVRSHQAEIIIVKRHIQGCNNVTIGFGLNPDHSIRGRCTNDAFTHSATLPTNLIKENIL